MDRTRTHKTHLCSTVCSQARTAQLTRLAQELHCHLCAPKQVLSSGVTHVSSMVVLSHAFLHEHFLFFHLSTYPTTHREHSVHPMMYRKIWRRRSPSSHHRRSEGIWRNWDSRIAGISNFSDVLLPIANAFRRFRGKHCRF